MKKLHSFFLLLISCFPFVREYRLRKKLQLKRKKIYAQLNKKRNERLKRYLLFSDSIRRS